mmetsp:Transcript_55427/g.166176  ORF Transcript_55427/g.166176 Transcript_55427/m.166176 type:complete len:425 (-) Transcript_55427:1147-2421(-)
MDRVPPDDGPPRVGRRGPLGIREAPPGRRLARPVGPARALRPRSDVRQARSDPQREGGRPGTRVGVRASEAAGLRPAVRGGGGAGGGGARLRGRGQWGPRRLRCGARRRGVHRAGASGHLETQWQRRTVGRRRARGRQGPSAGGGRQGRRRPRRAAPRRGSTRRVGASALASIPSRLAGPAEGPGGRPLDGVRPVGGSRAAGDFPRQYAIYSGCFCSQSLRINAGSHGVGVGRWSATSVYPSGGSALNSSPGAHTGRVLPVHVRGCFLSRRLSRGEPTLGFGRRSRLPRQRLGSALHPRLRPHGSHRSLGRRGLAPSQPQPSGAGLGQCGERRRIPRFPPPRPERRQRAQGTWRREAHPGTIPRRGRGRPGRLGVLRVSPLRRRRRRGVGPAHVAPARHGAARKGCHSAGGTRTSRLSRLPVGG